MDYVGHRRDTKKSRNPPTGGSSKDMDLTQVRWRKASYSGGNGGGCVEVGVWHKASYSGGNGGGCREVSATPDTASGPHKADQDLPYLFRHSKDPHGPKPAFPPPELESVLPGTQDRGLDPRLQS